MYSIIKKLTEDKELTIGYFGGSITEGAGASQKDITSWRGMISRWFRSTYPDCRITDVNAAISGTGSDLAAFRCKNDLLAHKPDLIFMEFAVNDYKRPEDDILKCMEGIVRQIFRQNEQADIIFIYTISEEMAFKDYEAGKAPVSISVHQKVAEHYGLKSVNVGKALLDYITLNGQWRDFLPDGVHPSDQAYEIYAKTIQAFLEKELVGDHEKRVGIPSPMTVSPLERGILVDAWNSELYEWEKENQSLSGRYPHYISCNQPGKELKFHFSGSSIGVYWMIAPDSGDIEWCIDDGPWKRTSSWDRYALEFTRANYTILNQSLERREHILRMKVSDIKNDASKGTWVRIGAFLVEE